MVLREIKVKNNDTNTLKESTNILKTRKKLQEY